LIPQSLKLKSKKEVKEQALINQSDIFYIMDALFPKDTVYKDSPFLKADDSCLQFKNGKSLDSAYDIF
jgi:hypothetical protein